ncbi:MAG: DUF4326 domain-containing protein [Sphingomonadales bacterium]|nr:DUF4326 domain-containing protein [Sphingomonadales bacterium]
MTSSLIKPLGVQRVRRKGLGGYMYPDGKPNGLPVKYVGRTASEFDFGNPFLFHKLSANDMDGRRVAETLFRDWILQDDPLVYLARHRWIRDHLHELAGHNLACWCRFNWPCHRTVYLEVLPILLPEVPDAAVASARKPAAASPLPPGASPPAPGGTPMQPMEAKYA